MTGRIHRVSVALDAARAWKLRLLAERTCTHEDTLAALLLAQAIDEADVDVRHVVDLLDDSPGAFERARLGLEQARSGQTMGIDEL